ncbi:TPA: DUF3265 domain-containing protein [Vibrio parahaemolyticus]|nr:DUF3265 domain-containing protein [Vibrio parahaemolyticus]
MTRRLRGIHAAWHFWYAVGFGGKSGLRKLGLGGTHPLTQRYVSHLGLYNFNGFRRVYIMYVTYLIPSVGEYYERQIVRDIKRLGRYRDLAYSSSMRSRSFL